jgi:hypothetical protein
MPMSRKPSSHEVVCLPLMTHDVPSVFAQGPHKLDELLGIAEAVKPKEHETRGADYT